MPDPAPNRPAFPADLPWVRTADRLPPRDGGVSGDEHVECLVIWRGQLLLRLWNKHDGAWDDEAGDDFFCGATEPTWWAAVTRPSASQASVPATDLAELDAVRGRLWDSIRDFTRAAQSLMSRYSPANMAEDLSQQWLQLGDAVLRAPKRDADAVARALSAAGLAGHVVAGQASLGDAGRLAAAGLVAIPDPSTRPNSTVQLRFTEFGMQVRDVLSARGKAA